MNALLLEMKFACGRCEEISTITVHCTGQGLASGPRAIAAVDVPCFHCGCHHQVCFHPTGEVIAAEPLRAAARCLVPSTN